MKTALVTSIGSVAVDITIKSLKRLGYRLIGTDIYPKGYNVDSMNVDVFYQVSPVKERQNYSQELIDICSAEHVDYILPMIDDEVDFFNDNRSEFEQKGITICISPSKAINIIRNKKTLSDFIRDNCPDIKNIPTLYVRDIDDLPWAYPVVCKPYNGRSSQGRVYIYNEDEWKTYKQTADKEFSIVEPFIPGYMVVVELVRSNDNNKCIAITRQELISTPHGCATTVRMFQDKSIEGRSCELARKLGINGCVNFEYIVDDKGEYHFVECNPRFSAGAEFSQMSGYALIENHMNCFTGKNIDDYVFQQEMIIARKYEEYITVVCKDQGTNPQHPLQCNA